MMDERKTMENTIDKSEASRQPHKRSGDELTGVRKAIFERCHDSGLTLADLSRAIGRNNAYVHQYMFKGTPRRLDGDSRMIIADLLKIAPDQLREPSERMRSQNALSAVKADLAPAKIREGIPLFRETEFIDLAKASNWVPAMPTVGPSVSFAVWIERPRKKLTPGNIVFAKPDHPVRPTDQVVVLAGNWVACLGEVHAVGVVSITVECLLQKQEFITNDVQILKIVGVAYP
jgi:hypothetical protein